MYTNRERLTLIEERIAAADSALRTYLGLYGLTIAVVGAFEVCLDGEDLQLTRLVMPDMRQLALPDPAAEDGPHQPIVVWEGGGGV